MIVAPCVFGFVDLKPSIACLSSKQGSHDLQVKAHAGYSKRLKALHPGAVPAAGRRCTFHLFSPVFCHYGDINN